MINQTRLRCIGGESDGVLMSVGRNARVGDHIHTPVRYECKIEDWKDDKRLPEIMTEATAAYRIAKFCFKKDDDYYFLVPVGWTDKEAILFQFSK